MSATVSTSMMKQFPSHSGIYSNNNNINDRHCMSMPHFNTPALPCWHCQIHVHTYTCKYFSVVTIVCYLCTHNMIQTIMQCTQHVMKLCYLTCVGSDTYWWSTPVLLQWISSRTTRSSGTRAVLSKCNPAMGWQAVWEYKRRCNITQITA